MFHQQRQAWDRYSLCILSFKNALVLAQQKTWRRFAGANRRLRAAALELKVMPPRTGQMVTPLELTLLALLGLLWGMPYALTKIALATIPPVTLTAARVALAAAVLWALVFFRRKNVPQRGSIVPLFIQGCVACAFPYALIAFGQQSVDSALAAILNSTTPIFVCLISLLWTRHEPLTGARLVGVATGLAGVALIAGAGALAGLGRATVGQAAVLLATLSSALSIVYARRFAAVAPEITAAGALTAAALVLVPLCFLVEAPLTSMPSAASLAALLVNAVAPTALGFVVYFRLIRTIGSMGTASVGYLKPAFGVLIGCAVMGESLTWTMVTGLIAILIGVAAINQREPLGALPRSGACDGPLLPQDAPDRALRFDQQS